MVQPKYLGRLTTKAHEFEQELFTSRYMTPGVSKEKSYWFDDYGRVINSKEGDTHRIKYSLSEVESMKNHRLTHSHSIGYPPSHDDIIFAVLIANLKEIRAVGIFNGKRLIHSVERIGENWIYIDGSPVNMDFISKSESIYKKNMTALIFFAELKGVKVEDLPEEILYDSFQNIVNELESMIKLDYKVFEDE